VTTKQHKKAIQKFWQEDFTECVKKKKGVAAYNKINVKDYSFLGDIAKKKTHKGPGQIAEFWKNLAPKNPKFIVSLDNIRIYDNLHFLFKESDSCYAPFDKIAVVYVKFVSNPNGAFFDALMGHVEDCIWVPIEFSL